MKNQFVRICIEILGGIIVSVVLCAIWIFFGYFHINSAELSNYTVSFFGVPIYEITNIADEMTGSAMNQNMSIIGISCSIILIFVVELIYYFKSKKTKSMENDTK